MDSAENLKLTVQNVANTLNLIADGDIAKAEDESLYQISESSGKDAEDVEPISMYDYIDDEMLDCSYRVSKNLDYEGAEVYITMGGPTIYIDTADCAVKGRWGSDTFEWGFTSAAQDMINEVMQQLYEAAA